MIEPPGGLLSCYTAAVALHLHRLGVDWRPPLATDPTLVLRVSATGLVISQYPRAVDRRPGGVSLTRVGVDDPDDASAGLREETTQTGCAIVVGDTWALPWTSGYRRRHTPHWFVVGGGDATGWLVADALDLTDEDGGQRPWTGRLPASEHAAWAARTPDLSPSQRNRERYALGRCDPAADVGRYQWFRVAPDSEATAPVRPGSDPGGAGWLVGVAALRWLADAIRGPDGVGLVTAHADDLWAAARHRKLKATIRGDPADVARARQWESLPLACRYVTESAARGRRVRVEPVAAVLSQLAGMEEATEEAMARTGAEPR